MIKLFPKISVTGDLGSGKSAVCKLLEQQTGFPIVSTGGIQREIASKHGMTTLELNKYTETHPEIDDEIDGRISQLGKDERSIIFDSRLAWHFAPETFKIYLLADTDIAATRIFNDTRTSESYKSVREAKQKILDRRTSELNRFKSYYDIDYSDMSNYDLVVETTTATPEEVAGTIISQFNLWKNGKPYNVFWLSPSSLLPTANISTLLSDAPKPETEAGLGQALLLSLGRSFIIAGNHLVVSKAINEGKHLLPVFVFKPEAGKTGKLKILSLARKNAVKEWEQHHKIKFSELPDIFS
ncbi:MAG: cytidylate kinase family protein [Bacteroidota bacterium]